MTNPVSRTYKVNATNILVRKPSQYHIQKEDGQYEYGYFTGNAAKYEIKTADGITRGSYSYTDPNEILRATSYISDDKNGFRASSTMHGIKKDQVEIKGNRNIGNITPL